MDNCRNRKLKPRPEWDKQVKPAYPLIKVIGETLERIHAVPSDVPNLKAGYKSVVFCFGNGKSIHLDAEMHLCKEGVIPIIRSRDGDWEMLKAEPEEPVPPPIEEYSEADVSLPATEQDIPMPEVKPSREPGEASLHEIDGANQD